MAGQPCSDDKKLGVKVHRYDPGATVCRCGLQDVTPPPAKKGTPWRHQSRNFTSQADVREEK